MLGYTQPCTNFNGQNFIMINPNEGTAVQSVYLLDYEDLSEIFELCLMTVCTAVCLLRGRAVLIVLSLKVSWGWSFTCFIRLLGRRRMNFAPLPVLSPVRISKHSMNFSLEPANFHYLHLSYKFKFQAL